MSSTVGRNSLIMASGTAASRVTGQIRTILLAAAIGTTGLAANAYQAGAMIPQTVFTLVSGGIFNDCRNALGLGEGDVDRFRNARQTFIFRNLHQMAAWVKVQQG